MLVLLPGALLLCMVSSYQFSPVLTGSKAMSFSRTSLTIHAREVPISMPVTVPHGSCLPMEHVSVRNGFLSLFADLPSVCQPHEIKGAVSKDWRKQFPSSCCK